MAEQIFSNKGGGRDREGQCSLRLDMAHTDPAQAFLCLEIAEQCAMREVVEKGKL